MAEDANLNQGSTESFQISLKKALLPCVAATVPIQSSGNAAPVQPDELPLLMVNEYGCLRWSLIRSAYHGNLIDENDVVDIYKEWKDTSEFLVLKGKKEVQIPSLTPEGSGQIFYHVFYKFMKAAKRGNDVYKKLVQQKFNVLNKIEPVVFFEREWKTKSTNLLFITLTYGKKACSSCGKHFKESLRVCPYCKSTHVHHVSIAEAWDKIGRAHV